MKKTLVFTALLILLSCATGVASKAPVIAPESTPAQATAPVTGPAPAPAAIPATSPENERSLYHQLGLDEQVTFEAFKSAFEGYNTVRGRRREVLTLIDFTKPSTDKRLWVIDMANRRVLFNTWVAHGQGSGGNYATHFSNRSGSHQSSLGLYLTGETYIGGNGYSLHLDGLEPGVNDNARARAVVVHGAAYVDPSVIASSGRLGRSWGCPALPKKVTKPIIDTIKDGSVLYIYGKNS